MKKDKTVFEEMTKEYKVPKAVFKSLAALKKKTRGPGKIPVLILEDKTQKMKMIVFLSNDVRKIVKSIDNVERKFTELVIEQLLRKR